MAKKSQYQYFETKLGETVYSYKVGANGVTFISEDDYGDKIKIKMTSEQLGDLSVCFELMHLPFYVLGE